MFFCVCLPKGCGVNWLVKYFELNKSFYGLKQASRTMACPPNDVSQKTWFRAMYDKMYYVLCVFRFIEDGRVAITAAVYVDDIFTVGQKERCTPSQVMR